MIRYSLVLLSVLAAPAMAHTADHIHAHETDYLSLALGLTLIVAAVGTAIAIKVRNK